MQNPFRRKSKADVAERLRLLSVMADTDPTSPEYETLMKRLNEIDRVNNRTSELKKTLIPAFGSIGAIGGIYALQQFGGVIVPKALDSLAARQERKKDPEELN